MIDPTSVVEGAMAGIASQSAIDMMKPSTQENIVQLLTEIRDAISPQEKYNINYPVALQPFPYEYVVETDWYGKPHFCIFFHDSTPTRFDIDGVGTFNATLGPGWVQADLHGRVSTTDSISHNIIASYREDAVGDAIVIAVAGQSVNVSQYGGQNVQPFNSDVVSPNSIIELGIGLFDQADASVVRWYSPKGVGDANAGAGFGAVAPYIFNGALWDRLRTPNTVKTAILTAAGDTAVWTPAASKKFRVMRYFIQVTQNAAAAAPGMLEILLRDATTPTGVGFSVFIPGAAGTTLGSEVSTPWVDLGNGIPSAAANNVLNGNLSFALTAGEVRIVAIGTEE